MRNLLWWWVHLCKKCSKMSLHMSPKVENTTYRYDVISPLSVKYFRHPTPLSSSALNLEMNGGNFKSWQPLLRKLWHFEDIWNLYFFSFYNSLDQHLSFCVHFTHLLPPLASFEATSASLISFARPPSSHFSFLPTPASLYPLFSPPPTSLNSLWKLICSKLYPKKSIGVGCACPPPHSLWFWKQFHFPLHMVLNPEPFGLELSALTSCPMWTCQLYLHSSTL